MASPALRAVAGHCTAEAAERQLFAWHADRFPLPKPCQGPTITRNHRPMPGSNASTTHFDWYGNCYDQSCYDCIGCVQLRTPRPPPAPRYPPPPAPMQVVKPLWCSQLSGRGDALKQDPPLMCPELDHDDCSKFYIYFHGVSIPCMWTEVRQVQQPRPPDPNPLSPHRNPCCCPLQGMCEAADECMDWASPRRPGRRPPPRRRYLHRRRRSTAAPAALASTAEPMPDPPNHRHRRRRRHHHHRSSARTAVTFTSMRAATTAGSTRASSTRRTIVARWHRRRSTAAAS